MVVNKLHHSIELKLQTQLPYETDTLKTFVLPPNKCFPIPLMHTHASISAKPANSKQMYLFSPPISWEEVNKPDDCVYELRSCNTNKGHLYR